MSTVSRQIETTRSFVQSKFFFTTVNINSLNTDTVPKWWKTEMASKIWLCSRMPVYYWHVCWVLCELLTFSIDVAFLCKPSNRRWLKARRTNGILTYLLTWWNAAVSPFPLVLISFGKTASPPKYRLHHCLQIRRVRCYTYYVVEQAVACIAAHILPPSQIGSHCRGNLRRWTTGSSACLCRSSNARSCHGTDRSSPADCTLLNIVYHSQTLADVFYRTNWLCQRLPNPIPCSPLDRYLLIIRQWIFWCNATVFSPKY